MLKTEILNIDGVAYIKYTTDTPKFDEEGNQLPTILQVETGQFFVDAIDKVPSVYTYKDMADEVTPEKETHIDA